MDDPYDTAPWPPARLVVGGAHDGQLRWSKADYITIPIDKPAPELIKDASDEPLLDTIEVAIYREFPHGIGKRKFKVWVPKEWSDEEASAEVFGRVADLWAEKV